MKSSLQKVGRTRGFVTLALVSALLLTAAAGCGNQGSRTQPSPAEPLKGKTITLIVPYSPGGGFDTYARLIQPYLAKYSGATVVVQNVPGGGSIIGSNQLYASKADGLTIGIMGGVSLMFAQTAGTSGIKFDIAKYTWLGRLSADPSVLLVSAKKPYQTVDDLKKAPELKLGVTGVGEDDFYTWAVLAKAFGINNYKMVTGWEGSSQWLAAVSAGQLDGGEISAGSAQNPVANGFARVIFQVAPKRDSRFPDVPTALELMPANDPNRGLVEAITNILAADRVLAAPPGLSPELTKTLREAVQKAANDSEFVDKAAKAKRPVAFLGGEELQKTIEGGMAKAQELKPIFDAAAEKAK